MEQMTQAVKNALGNYNFLYLYLGALILAFILWNGKRKIILIPAALITLAVLTPRFYNIWNELNDYAYWRTLWMIPVIPICAAVPALIIEKQNKEWMKIMTVIAGAMVVFYCGSYIYKYQYTTFKKANNADKLPDEVCEVGDELLDMEEYPYVVTDLDLSIYLRQYSGKIHMPYGRKIGTKQDSLAREIYDEVLDETGDMGKVSTLMLNHGYKYLVTKADSETKLEAMENAGFSLEKQVGIYGIYSVSGTPSEIRTYTEKGLVRSVTTVDTDGNPIMANGGYATAIYDYDINGQVIYEFHLDTEGNGSTDASGKAGYKRTYDLWGDILTETNIGVDDNPIIVGYCSRKCEYNNEHNLIKESFYDIEGNAMINTDTYYATREIFYDKDEMITGERYYNTDGNLIISKYGYAGYDREIDKKEGIVIDRYVGIDGGYMITANGCAGCKRSCDEAGNIIGDYYKDSTGEGTYEIYLDMDGEETLCRQGYSAIHREYNEEGHVSRYSYYAFDEPVLLGKGYASSEREYDSAGNLLNEIFYNIEGQIAINSSGFAILNGVYDDKGRIIKQSYIDEEYNYNHLYTDYVSVTRDYNEYGDVIDETYYDEYDDPITTSLGYDELRREYNDKRQLVSESYYVGGQLIALSDKKYASFKRDYDELGNMICEKYFDTDGNPVVCNGNYASLVREYDELRHVAAEYYLDENDKKTTCIYGYASVIRKYDAIGNVIEEIYLDENDKPKISSLGYSSVKREYNELYQLVRESYYDIYDKPIINADGYAAYEQEYDERNNLLFVRYLDVDGNLIDTSDGYAEIKYEYLPDGQLSLISYCDKEGNELDMGSSYFHRYLQSLKGKDITIFISIKNEGTYGLTDTLIDDFTSIGLNTNLKGKKWCSYYAVIDGESVIEDIGREALSHSGKVGECEYIISSAAYKVGNQSSIIINGNEYSKNVRGINIVVYDNQKNKIQDSLGIDTYTSVMWVTR